MKVKKVDGSIVEYNVSDIDEVFFERVETNPNNPNGKVGTAIDLGLSCLWASWNVGASSEKESGGLYGWADGNGNKCSTDLSDYPSSAPPSDIVGTEYDIARQKWGGDWRLPTKEELSELYSQCSWSYYSEGESYYLSVTGPNGKSIIFPMSGYRYGTDIEKSGAYYWSGTLYGADEPNYAWGIGVDQADWSMGLTGYHRVYGLAVRPVCDKPVEITVTTGTANNITTTGAIISGNSVSGISSPTTVGVIYGTSSDLSSTNGSKKSTTSSGSFSITLSDLNDGTTYYYRAFAVVDGEYYYGTTESFKTNIGIIVTTGTAENITSTEATISGNSVSGLSLLTMVGVIYGTSSDLSSTNGSEIMVVSSGGSFSITLENLNSGTTYYYRAFTAVNGEYYYGETKSFKTKTTGYAVGDPYPDATNPIGIVFEISNGGKNGKIVSLDYGKGLQWDVSHPFEEACYSTSTTNGLSNTNKMPSSNLSPAAKWCRQKGDGWYCPARSELVTLNNKLSTVNSTLKSFGYSGHEGFYWSSTENSSNQTTAYKVCLTLTKYMGYEGGWYGYVSKNQENRVCAMKEF